MTGKKGINLVTEGSARKHISFALSADAGNTHREKWQLLEEDMVEIMRNQFVLCYGYRGLKGLNCDLIYSGSEQRTKEGKVAIEQLAHTGPTLVYQHP